MKGKRNPFVAHEGIPWLIAVAVAFGVVYQFADAIFLLIPFLVFVWLYAIFRDPKRAIPAVPLALSVRSTALSGRLA